MLQKYRQSFDKDARERGLLERDFRQQQCKMAIQEGCFSRGTKETGGRGTGNVMDTFRRSSNVEGMQV